MSGIEPYSCETEMNNLNAQWEMSYSDLRAIARFFFCVCVCVQCASIVLCSQFFFRSSFSSQMHSFRNFVMNGAT